MITAERTVAADPERVWRLVSRVADWADLLPTVQRATAKTAGGAPGVGARYAVKQPGLPVLVYEISEWEPGVAFTWVAPAPGVRTVGTHAVAPAAGGSSLRLTLSWTGPLAGAVERLFGARTTAYVQQEADAFVRLAEQGGRA